MPRYQSHFKRPLTQDGREMITVEELAELSGLSTHHLRERARPNGRGGYIPSSKKGIRLWFDKDLAMKAIYADAPRSNTSSRNVEIRQQPDSDILAGLI